MTERRPVSSSTQARGASPGAVSRGQQPFASRPSTAGQQSTGTATNNSIFRAKQEQRRIVALLQGTIADTYKERPDGVSAEEVDARRAELQRMLDAVQADQRSTYHEAAEFQIQRWSTALADQEAREQAIVDRGARRHGESEAQHQERCQLRDEINAQRAQVRDQKTEKAFNYLIDRQFKKMQKLRSEVERKDRQVDNLRVQREIKRAELFNKQRAAQLHAAELQKRKDEQLKAQQRQTEEAMLEHQRIAAERAEEVAKRKRQKAEAAKRRQRQASQKGAVNQVHVVMDKGSVRLEVEEVDYVERLNRLRENQARRDEIVEEVKGGLREQRQQYESKLHSLEEQQRIRRDQIADQRLEKQMALLEHGRQRSTRLQREKEARDARLEREAAQHAREVAEHQRKMDERARARANENYNRTYGRWTRKAEVIAENVSSSPAFAHASHLVALKRRESANPSPPAGRMEQSAMQRSATAEPLPPAHRGVDY